MRRERETVNEDQPCYWLSSAACSSNCPLNSPALHQSALGYSYAYDVQGNRWQQNLTQGTGSNILHTYSAWNHIIDGTVNYDSAGNITWDSSNSYSFDPEGRLLTINGSAAQYTYDAFGRRVVQQNSSGTFEYLFDLQNHPITKLQSGQRVSGEVWFGKHWASNTGSQVNFMHSDWLGAGRLWTDVNGNVTLQCETSPFADMLYCSGSGNNFDDVFAGLKFNFDDFQFDSLTRQYNGGQGRWTVPDPAGLAAADPTNPQTWNRYAYVTNNPVSMVDPLGLDGDEGGGGMMGGPAGVWSPTSSGGPCFMCGLNNAALYGLQPMANSLANLEAQSETSFLTSGSIGWYSVQGGELYTTLGFYTPNPSYEPNDPNSVLGTSTTILLDMGPVSSGQNAANNMTPDVPLNPDAVKIFTEVYHRAAPIGNPCFYGAWAIGATAAGTVGAATANYQTIQAAAAENYPTLFTKVVNWLFGKAANPGPVGLVGAGVRQIGSQVNSVCSQSQ